MHAGCYPGHANAALTATKCHTCSHTPSSARVSVAQKAYSVQHRHLLPAASVLVEYDPEPVSWSDTVLTFGNILKVKASETLAMR